MSVVVVSMLVSFVVSIAVSITVMNFQQKMIERWMSDFF